MEATRQPRAQGKATYSVGPHYSKPAFHGKVAQLRFRVLDAGAVEYLDAHRAGGFEDVVLLDSHSSGGQLPASPPSTHLEVDSERRRSAWPRGQRNAMKKAHCVHPLLPSLGNSGGVYMVPLMSGSSTRGQLARTPANALVGPETRLGSFGPCHTYRVVFAAPINLP